ncbi:MAG: hypothetical protein K8T91_21815 [Planctomycetes bacterium]|nr:hypothetical protein [Planctomycetota bacterium]
MTRRLTTAILCGGILCFLATSTRAAELTPAAVADPKGDGPDGKGNTTDDTWQFWFSLLHSPEYHRLDLGTAALSADQRKNGIRDERARRGKQKVQGPIGAMLPNPADTEGWIYHSDWDGRYEGVWGDKKANQVIMHPYNEKTDGGNVAVTYTVLADGAYNISGKVTDLAVAKGDHAMLTGITYKVDVVAGGGDSISKIEKPLAEGKVGDKVGPESAEFKVDKVDLKKGQLVRLAIDPNKWWGGDMTKIDSFKIEPVK